MIWTIASYIDNLCLHKKYLTTTKGTKIPLISQLFELIILELWN